ncbi:MAG TPA: response regulator [Leptospiraceae bacterium]|nr:response regulator [Leptospiraceae bacterium]HMY67838.1 response regulator [Leptospiraceae bacterium]HMZ58156.1 response regulator [Leptospiraceae bacterium]HNF12166.1 response regulator [Leptospiraceae bacterium]HNF23359.1 response regulator [Leptospiraceae bacterium]
MNIDILVVDDESTVLFTMHELICSLGYTCDCEADPEAAVEKIKNNKYKIMITDLQMPSMKGEELLEKVRSADEDIVCIVATGVTDIRRIVSSLSEYKAYDFMMKPVDRLFLKDRIEKAMELVSLRKKIGELVTNEAVFFQDILKVFDWKKELQKQKFESFASKIIRQLNIGLFHGGGIGGLLSVLSLVLGKIQKNPDSGKYELTEKQYQMIKENYAMSKEIAAGFSKAQSCLMDDSVYEDFISVSDLPAVFEQYKSALDPMLKIKEQKLSISSIPSGARTKKVLFDREAMRSVFSELLINAMKYSEFGDTIYVIFFIHDKNVEIKILNPAYPNQDGTVGIAGNNETMIFEPFFRLSNVAVEGYYMEEFSAGIGLAVVRKILEKHNSSINIFTVKDHQRNRQGSDISVTVSLPFLSAETLDGAYSKGLKEWAV